MIRNIVFDLGKVLVSFEPEEGMRKMGLSSEVNRLFQEKIFGGLWESCDRIPRGEAETRALFKSAVPGYEKEADILCDRVELLTDAMPYAEPWLKRLKDAGYRVYILSNYGKQSFEVNRRKYDFLKYADGQLISYEVELVKPDPRIYEELCSRFSIRSEESVFLDDRSENVEAARRLGFYGIRFVSYENGCGELERLIRETE